MKQICLNMHYETNNPLRTAREFTCFVWISEKQRLFRKSTVTNWYLWPRWSVFTARYELNLYIYIYIYIYIYCKLLSNCWSILDSIIWRHKCQNSLALYIYIYNIDYWIHNDTYSAFLMIIINLIIDKSRLCYKITIKYWQNVLYSQLY